MEKDVRANNIIIFNSKFQSGDLLNYTVNLLNTNLGLQLITRDINNMYTIGKDQENKPIIVKLVLNLEQEIERKERVIYET